MKLIVEGNKAANDYKNFEFELIKHFSITSPVTENEFGKVAGKELTQRIYKEALSHYESKMERNAAIAFPVIRNVYEDPNSRYERIVVPFSDGQQTLNVVTDLKKAYDSQGKQLIADFEKNISLAIIDDAWKNTSSKNG